MNEQPHVRTMGRRPLWLRALLWLALLGAVGLLLREVGKILGTGRLFHG